LPTLDPVEREVLMMAQRYVAVLLGGPSSEHEVSISSGLQVIAHLDRARYQVAAVYLDRDCGVYPFASVDPRFQLPAKLDGQTRLDLLGGLGWLERQGVSVVFLALHGHFGEDGQVQALLESAGLAYTGSRVAASALAMDKHLTKLVAQSVGVPVAPWVRWCAPHDPDWQRETAWLQEQVGLPCVVKPNAGGSSVGLNLAETREQLASALHVGGGEELIVERFLLGEELTVGVLETADGPRALPPILIRAAHSRMFDYEAKYQPGMAEEICPAPISRSIEKRVTEHALALHRLLSCRGASRSDFIVSDGEPHFLELNTLPGLTANSLVPKAARVAGLSFPALLDALLDPAEFRLERT
jgi:D-alanine-D-alanine ligase